MKKGEIGKTGVLGLGEMGSALADALLERGQNVVVWNRSPQKSRRYADAGVEVAESASSLASRCDLLVVCVTGFETSMALLGTDSVAEKLAGKALVLTTTMSVDDSLRAAEWAQQRNIGYLDGAILGYPEHMRAQQCSVVYSGSKRLYDACSPVLSAMGGMPRLVGEKHGMALIFCNAVYSAYYARCLGLFHGAAMCSAGGVSLEHYIENFTGYWDSSVEAGVFLDMIKTRDYPRIDARMQLHAAAFSHVGPLARKLGVDTTLTEAISGYFERALESGLEDLELPALFEVLGKR